MDKLQTKLQEILQKDPVERSIAARFPRYDPFYDAQQYVMMTMQPDKQTPEALIPAVFKRLEMTAAAWSGTNEVQYKAYLDGIEEIRPALTAKMQASYGLAEYLWAFGSHSLFLPRYYATLYHPLAMDAAFCKVVRLDGEFMMVPIDDPAYILGASEPIFRTVRSRTALHELLQAELGEDALVVALGAAMLPEQRHFGWQERGIKQRVIAYDNAPGTAECLKLVFPDKPLADYGIEYRFEDFHKAFEDPELQGKVDLVGMEGCLSYYKDETVDILTKVANLLRPGGHFCGEVELKHIYTIRCGILGWQMSRPMQFDDDADSAVARLTEAAELAGLEMAEVYVDDRNEQPAMVWVHLQKPNN